LEGRRLELLEEVYRTLLPLHNCGETFLKTSDATAFRWSKFLDSNSRDKASRFETQGQMRNGK
jgi:hypothetical protein